MTKQTLEASPATQAALARFRAAADAHQRAGLWNDEALAQRIRDRAREEMLAAYDEANDDAGQTDWWDAIIEMDEVLDDLGIRPQ